MRTLLFVSAMILAACADQDTDGVNGDDNGHIIHVSGDAGATQDPPTSAARPLTPAGQDPATDVCRLLPDGDGACAHACDPVALKAYIPSGTCASFTCTLTDGSLYRTGGCNR